MPLPSLASVSDAAIYGYDVTVEMLDRASARVRRFTQQRITPGSSTVTVVGIGPWLLPQRPVTSVTSVVDASGAAVEWTVTGSRLASTACAPLTVSYEHGFAEVPDELVELVSAIAARLGSMPAAVAAGAQTEQAGGESVTWGVQAFGSSNGLLPSEESALRQLFPRLPSTVILL